MQEDIKLKIEFFLSFITVTKNCIDLGYTN